jgi:hypothetical protein
MVTLEIKACLYFSVLPDPTTILKMEADESSTL